MRTRTRHRIYLASAYSIIALIIGAMFFEGFQRQMGKFVGMMLAIFGLTACSTVSFSSDPSVYEATVQKQIAPASVTPKQAAAIIAPLPARAATLRHGRFIVEVGNNAHEIQGGVFTPAAMSVSSTATHVLVSNYSTKEFSYHRRTKTGSYEPVIGYAVVTPRPEELPFAQVRGRVTRIDLKPTWCPGKEARKKYPKLPAGCLPFGHVDNAMGDFKFEIAWQGVKGWDAIRIHGREGYSLDGAFWDYETLGCTGLQNDAGLALIDLLGPQAVKEGIEVILERGNTLQRHAL